MGKTGAAGRAGYLIRPESTLSALPSGASAVRRCDPFTVPVATTAALVPREAGRVTPLALAGGRVDRPAAGPAAAAAFSLESAALALPLGFAALPFGLADLAALPAAFFAAFAPPALRVSALAGSALAAAVRAGALAAPRVALARAADVPLLGVAPAAAAVF